MHDVGLFPVRKLNGKLMFPSVLSAPGGNVLSSPPDAFGALDFLSCSIIILAKKKPIFARSCIFNDFEPLKRMPRKILGNGIKLPNDIVSDYSRALSTHQRPAWLC